MKRRGNVEEYNYNYRDSFHLFVAAEFDAGRVTVVTAAAAFASNATGAILLLLLLFFFNFLHLPQLTWADIVVYEVCYGLVSPDDPLYTKYLNDRLGDERLKCLEGAPLLRKHMEMVAELPRIKKYLEERPARENKKF